MRKYELKPVYDNVKSFYKKAYIIDDEGVADKKLRLLSYDTEVAYIDNKGVPHLLDKFNYSKTTLRHVKEFIKQAGYETAPAKKLFSMYGNLHIAENYENTKLYKM